MPNMPGATAMTDTLDFVKNLWGSMSVPGISVPGMVAPTLSVDELDKKIADLKAVESWLNVNLSMLHGTIQALEIQRGTIATLKSMGAALATAVKQPGANEKSVLAAAPYASAFFPQPAEPKAEHRPEPKTAAAPEAPAPSQDAAAPSAAAGQLANPNVWWNMLQDQFKQAVTTAMSSEAMTGAAARAQDAASKLAEAGAEQVAKLGKTTPKAAAQSTGASASAPAKNAAPAKAASKRAPAQPRTSKPKAGKRDL